MIPIGSTLLSPKSWAPLVLFCLIPFANATAQAKPTDYLNSNDPCSKYSTEDLRPFFRNPPRQAQISRADKLYSRSIVITAHDHCYSTHDFADMKAGGITVRTIKLTADNTYWTEGEMKWQAGELDFYPSAEAAVLRVKTNNPDVAIMYSRADILNAKRTGRLGVIVSFEGGAVATRLDGCLIPPIAPNCMLNVRNLFFKIGLRDFQPYWSQDNWLKKNDSPIKEWEDATLNPYGERVLQEMVKLGVVIDLSHMYAKPFQQAVKAIGKDQPFILSHAGVARVSLCGPKLAECSEYKDFEKSIEAGRTAILDDATIGMVVQHHGVIALNFLEPFVSTKSHLKGDDVTVSDLVDEIDYIQDHCGIEYVALGPDYIPWTKNFRIVRGLRDMTEIKNVAREMVTRKRGER